MSFWERVNVSVVIVTSHRSTQCAKKLTIYFFLKWKITIVNEIYKF